MKAANHWWKTEVWLRKRYAEVCSDTKHDQRFNVLGYQWRVLRFNDVTRQSAVKVMAASKVSDPSSIYYMQQPHVLAVPYTKSMVSAGLTALLSSNYDLVNAVNGNKEIRVLCIGHGGGSLPLFIASKIQGAVIDIVEIDPLVISTSIQAMGFPPFSVAVPSGHHALSRPNTMDEVLWKGIHERLFLYESDAEKFIRNTENVYDIIFIDAYDGDDIFPWKLWDLDSPFLQALGSRLHPHHGTVVVNLHSDESISSVDQSILLNGSMFLVCAAHTWICWWVTKDPLLTKRGFGLPVGCLDQDSVLNVLFAKSHEVDRDLNMPFPCLQYLNR
ncbi:Methyltransferase-like protein 13, partial [Bienertia sinuspersici]